MWGVAAPGKHYDPPAMGGAETGRSPESIQAARPRLRPKAQSLTVYLPHARLFLDDIEAIWHLLEELGKVEIETNRYELEGLDDLQAVSPDEAVDVTLRVRGDNDLTVYLHRNMGVISSWRATLGVRGAADQIADRVKQRRDWWDWLLHWWVPYLGLVLILGPVAVSLGPGLPGGLPGRWLGGSVAFLGLAVVTGWQLLRFIARDILVVPVRRLEAPSFWTRNRDAVVVGLVVGIVAAIIGAVAGVLLSRGH